MNHLSKILLLVLFIIFSFSPIVSANCKDKAPSKVALEEMFGKAVSCNSRWTACTDKSGKQIECPEPEGFVCFENDRHIKIKVEFDSSERAKRISIFDGMNFWETVQAATQIIMLNGRGKFLKKVEKSGVGDCITERKEQYEYLTMDFYSRNCQGSMPGGVTLTWEK
jgi:hypothetical protein